MGLLAVRFYPTLHQPVSEGRPCSSSGPSPLPNLPLVRLTYQGATPHGNTFLDSIRLLFVSARRDRSLGDPEDFPKIPLDAPESRACRRCRFRELCGRTDMD